MTLQKQKIIMTSKTTSTLLVAVMAIGMLVSVSSFSTDAHALEFDLITTITNQNPAVNEAFGHFIDSDNQSILVGARSLNTAVSSAYLYDMNGNTRFHPGNWYVLREKN